MSCRLGCLIPDMGIDDIERYCKEMPEYDYICQGDNARTPYGTRSFDVVYSTRERRF